MSTTFTVRCEGCFKTERHSIANFGDSLECANQVLKANGWIRRQFGPEGSTANPWFCSTDCAYESHASTEAANYWKQKAYEREKEFERYCQETPITPYLVFILGLFSIILLGGYIARL